MYVRKLFKCGNIDNIVNILRDYVSTNDEYVVYGFNRMINYEIVLLRKDDYLPLKLECIISSKNKAYAIYSGL